MSFFGSIWNGIKTVGKHVGNVVRKVGKTVADIGRPVLRTIGKGYEFAKHIPVLGKALEASPVGYGIEKGLKYGNQAIDIADEAGKGNFVNAGMKAGRAAGLL